MDNQLQSSVPIEDNTINTPARPQAVPSGSRSRPRLDRNAKRTDFSYSDTPKHTRNYKGAFVQNPEFDEDMDHSRKKNKSSVNADEDYNIEDIDYEPSTSPSPSPPYPSSKDSLSLNDSIHRSQQDSLVENLVISTTVSHSADTPRETADHSMHNPHMQIIPTHGHIEDVNTASKADLSPITEGDSSTNQNHQTDNLDFDQILHQIKTNSLKKESYKLYVNTNDSPNKSIQEIQNSINIFFSQNARSYFLGSEILQQAATAIIVISFSSLTIRDSYTQRTLLNTNLQFLIFRGNETLAQLLQHDIRHKLERTYNLTQVPKEFNQEDILALFKNLKLDVEEIKEIPITKFDRRTRKTSLRPTAWKKFTVTFKSYERAKKLVITDDVWALNLQNHNLLIEPMIYSSQFIKDQRNFHVIKVSGLPRNTTLHDLSNIIKLLKGKACIIPKRQLASGSWVTMNIAYIRVKKADHHIQFSSIDTPDGTIFFSQANATTCTICGHNEHEFRDCDKKGRNIPKRSNDDININKVTNDIINDIYRSSASYNPQFEYAPREFKDVIRPQQTYYQQYNRDNQRNSDYSSNTHRIQNDSIEEKDRQIQQLRKNLKASQERVTKLITLARNDQQAQPKVQPAPAVTSSNTSQKPVIRRRLSLPTDATSTIHNITFSGSNTVSNDQHISSPPQEQNDILPPPNLPVQNTLSSPLKDEKPNPLNDH